MYHCSLKVSFHEFVIASHILRTNVTNIHFPCNVLVISKLTYRFVLGCFIIIKPRDMGVSGNSHTLISVLDDCDVVLSRYRCCSHPCT